MRVKTFNRPQLNYVIGAICVLAFVSVAVSHATEVWTGPLIEYNQPTPDPTQASNQDRITPHVWLTRAVSKGLFNAFSETNATALSPADTEWAFGGLTNRTLLHYTNWLAWLNGQSPTTLVGKETVVHLISDDIYIALEFTNWVAGGSGGFAYQRSTPGPGILFGAMVNGGQFSFHYTTDVGFVYVIQSSSNLVDWAPLVTNTATGGSWFFSEPCEPAGARFYRVGRLPNP
jgi:hypothetical protein